MSFLINREDEILKLEKRRKIYQIVCGFAGIHFREIERVSLLATGSVRHHLNYLKRHGFIDELKDGSSLRYFPKMFKSENRILLGLLRQKNVRHILLYILTYSKINQREIANFVGLSPSTTSWYLKRLENNNIIISSKEGRDLYYRLIIDRKEIFNLLLIYKESFLDEMVDKFVDMWEFE